MCAQERPRDTPAYASIMTTAISSEILATTLEVMRDLLNEKGDPQAAYSLAVKLGRLQNPPADFLRYMALAAFYSGFHEEAFRISKKLIYARGTPLARDKVNHACYRDAINPPGDQSKWLATSPKENSQVAIIFTGLLRTFDRTYLNILNKLITPNNATVFLMCDSERTVGDLSQDAQSKWGHCGGVMVQHGRSSEFKNLIDYLLKTQPQLQPDKFLDFFPAPVLCAGGSILEYYQFSKGHEVMLEYERKHDVRFEVVIRSRLDIIFGNDIGILDFFNLRPDSHTIPEFPAEGLLSDSWTYFRNLGNAAIAECGNHSPPSDHVPAIQIQPPADIEEAISSSRYLWTLGHNQVWIGRREPMDQLSFLCHSYGKYDSRLPVSYNSESQFVLFCYHHNIQHLRLPEGKGTAYCTKKHLAQDLLENPEDDVDKGIIFTILRPRGWGGFTQ